MKENEFKSLGITKQLAYINRLEEVNRQKQALIENIEAELTKINKELKKKSKPWLV